LSKFAHNPKSEIFKTSLSSVKKEQRSKE
jgi:hypothetical protein